MPCRAAVKIFSNHCIKKEREKCVLGLANVPDVSNTVNELWISSASQRSVCQCSRLPQFLEKNGFVGKALNRDFV